MKNLDYKEAGLDRAESVCRALGAVESLVCCVREGNLHIVPEDELHALLDILNHQLALALRDARAEQSHMLSLVPQKDRMAATPLGR